MRAVAGGQVKVTYMLKAAAEADMQNWVKQIKLQSIAPTFLARGEEHMLYPAEYGRYQFFKNQRDFVNKLTDISEEMRFVSGSIILYTSLLPFYDSPSLNLFVAIPVSD